MYLLLCFWDYANCAWLFETQLWFESLCNVKKFTIPSQSCCLFVQMAIFPPIFFSNINFFCRFLLYYLQYHTFAEIWILCCSHSLYNSPQSNFYAGCYFTQYFAVCYCFGSKLIFYSSEVEGYCSPSFSEVSAITKYFKLSLDETKACLFNDQRWVCRSYGLPHVSFAPNLPYPCALSRYAALLPPNPLPVKRCVS